MKNKKSLAALALSLGLITSCVTLDKKGIKLSHLNNAAMLIQNSSLIYEDVYTYTKPAIEQFGKFGLYESNPIPRALQEKNLWELDLAYSMGLPILGNLIAYKIDKTGNLAKIVNGVVAAVQVFAIQNNSKLLVSRGWKENSSNVNRYVEIFRINY